MIKKTIISISFLLVIFTNSVSAQWWRTAIHDAAGALYGGTAVAGTIAVYSGGVGELTPAGWAAIGFGALLGGASGSLAASPVVKAPPAGPNLTFLAINPNNKLDSVGYKHNQLLTAYLKITQPTLASTDSSVLLADGTVKIVPKKGPIIINTPTSNTIFVINVNNLALEQVRYTNFVSQNKNTFNIDTSVVSQANYNTITNAAMASALNSNINSVDDAVQYVSNKLPVTLTPKI